MRRYRKSLKIVLIITPVFMAAVGFYLVFCKETKEERRIDLETMRVETIVWSGYYGMRKHRTTQISDTLVSMALDEKNITTGLDGVVTFYRFEKSPSFRSVCFFEGSERSMHSIPGERVRSVAFCLEVVEFIERNGPDALPHLRSIIIEARDHIRYPNWDMEEALKRCEKEIMENKTRGKHGDAGVVEKISWAGQLARPTDFGSDYTPLIGRIFLVDGRIFRFLVSAHR